MFYFVTERRELEALADAISCTSAGPHAYPTYDRKFAHVGKRSETKKSLNAQRGFHFELPQVADETIESR